jgi:hypothetical protein
VSKKFRISDTYVEGYFPLSLDIVKHIVQSWQELHVLVQLPSEFLINLQVLWSENEVARMRLGHQPTSGSTASSSGFPAPSRRRNVGICLASPETELKKPSFDTIGEFVVGKTSRRCARHCENALESAGDVLGSPLRIMVRKEMFLSREESRDLIWILTSFLGNAHEGNIW